MHSSVIDVSSHFFDISNIKVMPRKDSDRWTFVKKLFGHFPNLWQRAQFWPQAGLRLPHRQIQDLPSWLATPIGRFECFRWRSWPRLEFWPQKRIHACQLWSTKWCFSKARARVVGCRQKHPKFCSSQGWTRQISDFALGVYDFHAGQCSWPVSKEHLKLWFSTTICGSFTKLPSWGVWPVFFQSRTC